MSKTAKVVEYKTFELQFKEVMQSKADSDVGVIEGYASTFGNVDLGLDIVDAGAFKKTINDSVKWPILADHNPYDPIGINIEASEDTTGLFVKGELELGVSKAKERWLLSKQALKYGGRAGLSIGYLPIKAEPDKDNPRVRRLKELKMYEYSFVTFPMNTEALLTNAKFTGNIDKASFLVNHLIKQHGISLKDLEIALQKEAAQSDYDPTKLSQSIDRLIENFKN